MARASDTLASAVYPSALIQPYSIGRLRFARVYDKARRIRISGCLFLVGFLLWTTSFISFAVQLYAPDGMPFVFGAPAPVGVALNMLALLPTDVSTLRFSIACTVLVCAALTCVVLVHATHVSAGETILIGEWRCSGHASALACASAALFLYGVSALCSCAAFGLIPLLRTSPEAPRFLSRQWSALVAQQRSGFIEWAGPRWSRACKWMGVLSLPTFWLARAEYYRVKAPTAYRRFWQLFRVFWLGMGLVLCVSASLLVCDEPARIADANVIGMLVWMGTSLGVSAVLTPRNRRRFLYYLQQLLMGHVRSVSSAALIASIISGRDSTERLVERAQKSFVVIRAEHIYEEDLAASGLSGERVGPAKPDDLLRATSADEMRSRTELAPLGSCSGFFSHSWRDEEELPGAKYAALCAWAHDYRLAHDGASPTVWIDKACILQSNVSEELACLPIFLAGCQQLLVCAGPTYSSRLWCVMELFVFLLMGGTQERISVLPLVADFGSTTELSATNDARAHEVLLHQFSHFDARSARCFRPDDYEHLLSVIEASFGSIGHFNSEIRRTFSSPGTSAMSAIKSVADGVSTLVGVRSSPKVVRVLKPARVLPLTTGTGK